MLTNLDVAELFARAAEQAEGHSQRAYRRASSAALMWPLEVADLIAEGRSPQELWRVGPKLSKLIKGWVEDPPEIGERSPLREGFISFAHALEVVGEHPDWEEGLRGDLQMHTHYSDGKETVATMAEAVADKGYDYIAITDHSKGLKIAGGMDEPTLAKQIEEIDSVNGVLEAEGSPVRVLRALEMNISPDGSGDMEPESLESLDLVLGSFHSKLRIKEDQTDRYIAALKNPQINVLGHPRGRKFNFRAGLSADWKAVCEAAAENDKALEIDAYPDRQDLNVELLEIARESGTRISIGTDAHATWELEFIWVGIAAAILAGIDRDRILNYMPREELIAWAKGR
ncbi:MAG TPA: PHP domain-containing protein [Actinomycetota bacterium]|nr:PHP domain-containing protein [Actinomycetota bacterium]